MTNNSYKRKSQYERKVRHNETKLKKTRHASIISIQKNHNVLQELDKLKIEQENKKDTLNSLGVDTGEADRRAKGNL